jgi:hypothetical protein
MKMVVPKAPWSAAAKLPPCRWDSSEIKAAASLPPEGGFPLSRE